MRTQFPWFAFVALALPPVTNAVQPPLDLDNFSTGAYQKKLSSGEDDNTQSGGMVGGTRRTVFLVCQGPCGGQNPFDQEAGLQIRPGSPSALIYSAGYKVSPRVDVFYGNNAPLQLNLSNYDRFRVNLDGSDLVVNFNLEVFTPSGRAQTGCNLDASTNPVSIDFRFADFIWELGTPDWTNISIIIFIFQTGSAIGSNDFAVTSFQAIRTGEPPAEITCPGLGT